MSNFEIRPKHWYQWINPFWWRMAKRVEAVMNYQWEHGGKEEMERKLLDSVLYGTSEPEIYKDEGKRA